jgi:hypothetical protein
VDDFSAVELDVCQQRFVRQASNSYFKSKRVAPRAEGFAAIFCATVSGDHIDRCAPADLLRAPQAISIAPS